MLNDITHSRLLDLLTYDEERSELIWKVNRRGSARAGSVAGNSSGTGRQVQIDGRKYLIHRIIWFFIHKEWPPHEVDHADMNQGNNSLDNLRLATKSQNMMNRSLFKNNTSGIKGVSWHKRSQKWSTKITINGKNIHLGMFKDKEDARTALACARPEIHKEFSRSK